MLELCATCRVLNGMSETAQSRQFDRAPLTSGLPPALVGELIRSSTSTLPGILLAYFEGHKFHKGDWGTRRHLWRDEIGSDNVDQTSKSICPPV
jgi:hypothetical protein